MSSAADSAADSAAGTRKGDPMLPAERRASAWIALVYGVRMLGMFLILPVFAVHAATMPGGDRPGAVGLALGVYGLSQALLQIPFGALSDRLGRRKVITAGLLLMFVGSLVAAWAPSVGWVTVGRAIQGAGAVSAALGALVADLTRDSQRTKAMAMTGGMIGVSFAVSMIAAPMLYAQIGMSGIFLLTGLCSALSIAIVWLLVPGDADPAVADSAALTHAGSAIASAVPASRVWLDPDLLRLNFGIFALHMTQMAMFVVIPSRIVQEGVALPEHWKIYLPVVGASFVLMLPFIARAERTARIRPLFLVAIAMMALVQLGFGFLPTQLAVTILLLLLFFFSFNLLEAMLPSLISRLAPARSRGLAMGVYNTTQALGIFFGGLLGGLLAQRGGSAVLFSVTALAMLAWWLLARSAHRWPGRRDQPVGAGHVDQPEAASVPRAARGDAQ